MQIYKNERIYTIDSGYVIHFLSLVNCDHKKYGLDAVNIAYEEALAHALAYCGNKYHNKDFGGGIRFHNIDDLKQAIDESPNQLIGV